MRQGATLLPGSAFVARNMTAQLVEPVHHEVELQRLAPGHPDVSMARIRFPLGSTS